MTVTRVRAGSVAGGSAWGAAIVTVTARGRWWTGIPATVGTASSTARPGTVTVSTPELARMADSTA